MQIKNFDISLTNYRLDNLKNVKDNLEKNSVSFRNTKSEDLEKIFRNTNKEKNNKVINQINTVLHNIDDDQSKSPSFSPQVKDWFVNSYKHFMTIKDNERNKDGVPIFELKQSDLMKNTNLREVII